jgi:hypothetical protein
MLTGRPPFTGKTYLDVIRAHRYSLPESPKLLNPAIPGKVARLVESMMEKDPNKRPASAAEVIAAIDGINNVSASLSDEEREAARELVTSALFPAADWKTYVLRSLFAAVLVTMAGLAAWGMRYRYFTTAKHKLDLAQAAFLDGDYERASRYFGHVVYYHPDTPEADQAEHGIALIRYYHRHREQSKGGKTEVRESTQPYDEALALLEDGRRPEAVSLFKRYASDFPDTEFGALSALKLAELGEGPPVPEGEGETPTEQDDAGSEGPAQEPAG